MPKRKVSKERFRNKPAPEYWANEPEQFIYQKGELLIFQKDFDSLPTITISRVQLLEDANNVISWVNDNNLTGGWDKWNKIIGHSFQRQISRFDYNIFLEIILFGTLMFLKII